MSMLLRRAMMMASSLVKHIISSVTGLVSFSTNLALDMPSVLCEFTPVQSGSGDPSPNNVRPITGWTGLTAYRTGENHFDPSTVTPGYLSAAGVIQAQNATRLEYTSDLIPIPPGVTYVTAGYDGLASGEQGWVGCCLYDASGTFIQRFATTLSGWSYVLKISDHPNAKALKISARTWGHGTQGLCCIFSQNAAYTPYTGGTSIPIDWQSDAGTVYGGTLDAATGVLTKTMENIASYNGESIGEPWVSSKDVYTPGGTPTTGAQVVYTLPTPQIVQLTANQISSLIGTNNVWHNANGGITVEYYDNQ